MQDLKDAESWAKGQERKPFYNLTTDEFARAAQERGDQSEVQRWLNTIADKNGAGR